MPYMFRKVNGKCCVFKKNLPHRKVGCTKCNPESKRKYMAALHINAENLSFVNLLTFIEQYK
jgi:hypothetical protein